MEITKLPPVLLLNLVSTWAMVGLIWQIQIVHYPLFSEVGPDRFTNYARQHQRRITYVVFPLMLLELASSLLLCWHRPAGIGPAPIRLGVALVLLIWASTILIQVPQHGRLLRGYDAALCQQLVRGNWIRTYAWTARGGLVVWFVA